MNRKSNIELLRIISMVMIIGHHLSVHSSITCNYNAMGLNEFWLYLLRVGGKVGVDVFVLITGYFMIHKKDIKISKLLKLWLQAFFYSITIYVLAVLFTSVKFNKQEFINAVMPITHSCWWFATTYFVLYLFIPYINLFISKIDKLTYKKILILCTILWVIIPTFVKVNLYVNQLIWLIYLYGVGGYIKLYKDDIKLNGGMCICISIVLLLISAFFGIVLSVASTKYSVLRDYIFYYYDMYSIDVLLIALIMFLGFKNINIKNNKFINLVSSTTFGIYLIHDSRMLRKFVRIWQNVFKVDTIFNTSYFIIYSIFVISFIFIVCSVIELLRIYLLEKRYTKLVDKISIKIDNVKNKIVNSKILDKIF